MADKSATRTARCACGQLRIELRGEPIRTYACACRECQRITGSAFAYRAMFEAGAIVARNGSTLSWHRSEGPGRWIEHVRCPDCGTLVYQQGEALGERLSVSVGCFGDQAFPAPVMLYFASRKHHWLNLSVPATG